MSNQEQISAISEAIGEVAELIFLSTDEWQKALKAGHRNISDAFLQQHTSNLQIHLRSAMHDYKAVLRIQQEILEKFEITPGDDCYSLQEIWKELPWQMQKFNDDMRLIKALSDLEVKTMNDDGKQILYILKLKKS